MPQPACPHCGSPMPSSAHPHWPARTRDVVDKWTGIGAGYLAHARQRPAKDGARLADCDISTGEYESAHAGSLQGMTFELAVTDALIARENDPTLSPGLGEPLFVGSALGEVIRQPLDSRAVCPGAIKMHIM